MANIVEFASDYCEFYFRGETVCVPNGGRSTRSYYFLLRDDPTLIHHAQVDWINRTLIVNGQNVSGRKPIQRNLPAWF